MPSSTLTPNFTNRCRTNQTLTIWRREMLEAAKTARIDPVKLRKDGRESVFFIVFQIAPQCVRTEVGDLDSGIRAAIQKEGSLNNPIDTALVVRSLLKALKHSGVTFLLGVIVVYNDNTPRIFAMMLKKSLKGID